jgi:hypothetical protein
MPLMLFIVATTLACQAPPPTKVAPSDETIKASVNKALPLILKSLAEYPKHRDCFSCHHQAVPVLAVATAKSKGFAVEADAIAEPVELTEADLRTALKSYQKGEGQGGGVTRAGYAMLTLELGGRMQDEVTDAVSSFLLSRQDPVDHWRSSSNRPPSEASEFTSTYLALRALAAFAQKDQAEKVADRVAKAKKWLSEAKPKDTEDRVFQLLSLKVVSADPELISKAAENLLKTQRDDGGWSQLDNQPSDAYATGSALYALQQDGGLATDSPAYRKGLGYLLMTQREDGSWFVASRSKPFQPYFESGFPHGKDQFISMAATSWAIIALSLSCPAAP